MRAIAARLPAAGRAGRRAFSAEATTPTSPVVVNGIHIPDRLPEPDFHPRSNATPPVSAAHWEDDWSKEQIEEARHGNVMATWGPSSTMAAVPNIVRGEGVYLYDDAGKQYIDWTSQAICSNLGHTIPPQVKAAIDEQLETIPFIYSGLGITEPRARLSALMAELCPADINGFLFPCGGSEANEAAIRIARRFSGKEKIITHYRSYHGGTTSALAATGDFRRWFAERGGGGGAGYIKAFNPQPFHLEMGASEDEIAAYAVAMLEEQILMENPNEIAAVMMESICGAAGVLIHPQKYLQGVRALCDKYDILLILDEVMVGFGRTGTFWGFQNYEGVVPDIMTSAKGLSGSFLPLSVVGVKQEIKDHFMSSPLGWGATYQAHPVALACAYESVKHMVKEDVVGHVKKMEPVFLDGIQSLIDEHPSVKQGRGIGLFGCIDTINKQGRLTQPLQGPITERNMEFKKALAENGVYGLLRLPLMHAAPPLTINEEELRDGFDRVHAAIEQSLDKDFD